RARALRFVELPEISCRTFAGLILPFGAIRQYMSFPVEQGLLFRTAAKGRPPRKIIRGAKCALRRRESREILRLIRLADSLRTDNPHRIVSLGGFRRWYRGRRCERGARHRGRDRLR